VSFERQPDVLLDIVMPGMHAGELVRRLRRACPKLRVLALTAYDDERLVLRLLRAGVQGYLLKEEELETVAAAVHGVMRGEMPQELVAVVLSTGDFASLDCGCE